MCLDALLDEPEWMQVSFEISLNTGCRLQKREFQSIVSTCGKTRLPSRIFKGGADRAFSIPMPTALRPLLERLVKDRLDYTLDFPFQPSRRWQQFFIKLKKPYLCFHCLRVTYVNRLRRAGVPREVGMRLVNHASDLIHRICFNRVVGIVFPKPGGFVALFPLRIDLQLHELRNDCDHF